MGDIKGEHEVFQTAVGRGTDTVHKSQYRKGETPSFSKYLQYENMVRWGGIHLFVSR